MYQPYKKSKDVGKKYKQPCKFFLRGHCANKHCPYLHVRGGSANEGTVNSTTSSGAGGSGEAAGATNVLSTMLKLFFEKQQSAIYDAEQQMLDLSHLADYDDLKSVAKSVNFNTRTFCEALAACVRDLIVPPPSALVLKHNHIDSPFHLAKTLEEAGLHLPLRALSLADNGIASVEKISALKSFSNLTEIDLRGNPVTTQAEYRPKIKRLMPFLLGLDGEGLAAAPLRLPWPRFYTLTGAEAAMPRAEGDLVYDATQRAILNFIQGALFAPLESSPLHTSNNNSNSNSVVGEGLRVSGVDAVMDVYAPYAVLNLSLSGTEAAVSTPVRTASGASTMTQQREVIRDIVGLRLRQTESNHNIMLGVKSTQVAVGRAKVCAQLEHWLYPRNYDVVHYIHPGSPYVVVLDNLGCGPNAVVTMKQPLSVVTLHGVMMWRYRGPAGGQNNNNNNKNSTSGNNFTALRDAILIKRNFSRVLTVTSSQPGRWLIVNDMVSLYPFTGTLSEAQAQEEMQRTSALTGNTNNITMNAPLLQLSDEEVLYRDVHDYDILFSPASDPNRAARMGRRYHVPESVVATLCRYVHNDAELVTILLDLKDIPLATFEQLAQMVEMDPLAAILLGRLGNRFGIEPAAGVALLREHQMNWMSIEQALASKAPSGQ